MKAAFHLILQWQTEESLCFLAFENGRDVRRPTYVLTTR